jgi:hypothetical protein
VTAVASVKKYLDSEQAIQVHDLLTRETDRLVAQISPKVLELEVSVEPPVVLERLQRYEGLSETLTSVMATGCYWTNKECYSFWPRTLTKVASGVTGPKSYIEGTKYIGLYPALLLLYGGALAALARGRYRLMRSLLLEVKVRDNYNNERAAGDLVTTWDVLRPETAKRLGGNVFFLSNRLRDLLWEPMKEYFAQEPDYDKCFDRFEYLRSLIALYGNQNLGWQHLRCPGRFAWRRQVYDVFRDIDQEFQKAGKNWSVLRAGFFGGSADHFREIKQVHDQELAQVRW